MPNKSNARGPNRPNRKRNAPRKGNRRAPSLTQHMWANKVLTVQLKNTHKKEEIYPLPLDQLVSRANVGSDADIRLIGYTMSIALATGNDCSTVSMNIGHEGPWIRRSTDTDTFNQQSIEHSVRGKSLLFKKPVLHASEREYVNPDTSANSIDLRVRDPCGVIPGVVLKIEFRAKIIRKAPQTTFSNPDELATDRYEDQDVNSGAPAPPATVKHVPIRIVVTSSSPGNTIFNTDGVILSDQFTYTTTSSSRDTITVQKTDPTQSVSGQFTFAKTTSASDLQREFNAQGYDGDISAFFS